MTSSGNEANNFEESEANHMEDAGAEAYGMEFEDERLEDDFEEEDSMVWANEWLDNYVGQSQDVVCGAGELNEDHILQSVAELLISGK